MVEVIFKYEGNDINIQCNFEDKMKNIINKFFSKIKKDDNNNNIIFLYNGKIINEELKLDQQINEFDKNRKIMNIVIGVDNKSIMTENIILSKDVICPECGENILFNIKDYKINLFDCKNNHKKINVLLNEYKDSQNIDISKIICDQCKKGNKKLRRNAV